MIVAGIGGKLSALVRRLLALGDFHRIAAVFTKVCQQSFQPLGGQIVPPRMGDNSNPTRMMNDINSFLYCTPLWRNVTGFPTCEIFFENIANIGSLTLLNKETREVTTRHRPAIGHL